MENFFKGIFDTAQSVTITPAKLLMCIGCALLCGAIIALCHRVKNRSSQGFAIALTVLPAVVAVVIMMVNGNVGAGVAVAGAFSLVRFRSAPGSAREICAIFLAMGAGLVAGMGYLGYALLISVSLGIFTVLISLIAGGAQKNVRKRLRITVPEDLNYTEIFDGILKTYTKSYTLIKVKTANLGSLFRLTYSVVLKNDNFEKEFIDALRVRNGNLEISICAEEDGEVVL